MPKYLGRGDAASEGVLRLERKGGIYVPVKNYSECHLVLGDTENDDEDDILALIQIPQRGVAKAGAYCAGHSFKELGTVRHPTTHVKTILWEVTAEFSSSIIQADALNHTPDSTPESLRPKRRVYTEKEKERLFVDAITSEPVINANGEPIEVDHNDTIICLEIVRYESDFNMQFILDFCGRTNENPFYGAPQGTCLLDDIAEEEEEWGGKLTLRRTYLFKFKMRLPIPSNINLMTIQDKVGVELGAPEVDGNGYELNTWTVKPLHQGTLYRKAAGEPPVVVRQSGQPITINLRPDGTRSLNDQDLWYVVFNEVPRIDFAPLNLEF